MPRLSILCVIACIGLGLPQPGVAQDAKPRDVRSLTACVQDFSQSHGRSGTIAGCQGVLSGGCNALPTVDHAACIMDEYRAWDALLNKWWRPMKARAQEAGTWDTLLATQRAWISEKEAACTRAAQSGGSLGQITAAECQRDRTATKAVAFYFELFK